MVFRREDGVRRVWSWAELRNATAAASKALLEAGVGAGDVVGGGGVVPGAGSPQPTTTHSLVETGGGTGAHAPGPAGTAWHCWVSSVTEKLIGRAGSRRGSMPRACRGPLPSSTSSQPRTDSKSASARV